MVAIESRHRHKVTQAFSLGVSGSSAVAHRDFGLD